MFIQSNPDKEKKIIEELIASDEELRKQHELFLAEMEFKQALIDARKENNLTQKDISKLTGMSQQAVSRLERKGGGTIETLLRYLQSIGYTLTINKVQ